MTRFVPLEKQSKKAQKAYHRAQRGTWHDFSPVTRIVQSGKVYDRCREKQAAKNYFKESGL